MTQFKTLHESANSSLWNLGPRDPAVLTVRQAFKAPDPALQANRRARLADGPNGHRYGCFLSDLTGLASRSPAPTSNADIFRRETNCNAMSGFAASRFPRLETSGSFVAGSVFAPYERSLIKADLPRAVVIRKPALAGTHAPNHRAGPLRGGNAGRGLRPAFQAQRQLPFEIRRRKRANSSGSPHSST